ncbi:MAG TPA: AraC family transcriptional regulator [Rhizomicrobium sp.]
MFAQVTNGRETWRPRATVPRHRHDRAYAALVLCGGYEECGSRGRFRVGPGDVLLHGAFDAHLDRFDNRETMILDLKLPRRVPFALGSIADVDAAVRLAEKDAKAAGAYVCDRIVEKNAPPRDWRDALADVLLSEPNARLDAWAQEHRLSAETLSRGFGHTFGVTPATFRAEARAHRAYALIAGTAMPLCAIAADAGFADQPHMTRAVKALTGQAPQFWRRSNPFKTAA